VKCNKAISAREVKTGKGKTTVSEPVITDTEKAIESELVITDTGKVVESEPLNAVTLSIGLQDSGTEYFKASGRERKTSSK
jgi:hypothetical protein